MATILVHGGTLIDGTGAPRRSADVLIRDGRIARVAAGLATDRADRHIDARGLVVAPGAIDIHSHSDERMFLSPTLDSALHQGVTTVVCGNCGGAAAPVRGSAAAEQDRELARYGIVRSWSSFGEYAAEVERARPSINVCAFVGHGTLRMCVLGSAAREPSGAELDEMRSILAGALDEGAIGMSTGLIYPPSAYA
ncbi:MAG TPA: amidohydrolase family protein, partial [Gaiellaceae bacterium]|nr:amidohydrolase family protein [Gaiellaceae bacterium]